MALEDLIAQPIKAIMEVLVEVGMDLDRIDRCCRCREAGPVFRVHECKVGAWQRTSC